MQCTENKTLFLFNYFDVFLHFFFVSCHKIFSLLSVCTPFITVNDNAPPLQNIIGITSMFHIDVNEELVNTFYYCINN